MSPRWPYCLKGLRAIRKDSGYSAHRFSAAMTELLGYKVSPHRIGAIERGESSPNGEIIRAWGRLCDLDVHHVHFIMEDACAIDSMYADNMRERIDIITSPLEDRIRTLERHLALQERVNEQLRAKVINLKRELRGKEKGRQEQEGEGQEEPQEASPKKQRRGTICISKREKGKVERVRYI